MPAITTVALTNGSSHGAAVADAFRRHAIPLRAVIVERPPAASIGARAWNVLRTRGVLALVRAARLRSGSGLRGWQADEIVGVPGLDTEACAAQLRRLSPDLVVLAGAPILPAGTVEIARLGTLNAHPGLLPEYRGVDVVAWAILNGDPVGVTVHLVDAGIDTGRICRRAEIPIEAGDRLATVRRRAELAAAELMADVVAETIRSGSLACGEQSGRGPLYRRMDRDRLRRVEELLRGIA